MLRQRPRDRLLVGIETPQPPLFDLVIRDAIAILRCEGQCVILDQIAALLGKFRITFEVLVVFIISSVMLECQGDIKSTV